MGGVNLSPNLFEMRLVIFVEVPSKDSRSSNKQNLISYQNGEQAAIVNTCDC